MVLLDFAQNPGIEDLKEAYMYYEYPTGARESHLAWPSGTHGVLAEDSADGQKVEIPVEPMNVLVTGTTGYGKTEFTKAYIRRRFQQDENLFAVIYQMKPDDFTGEFLRPQDLVITFDEDDTLTAKGFHFFKWNLVREIRSVKQAEWDPLLHAISSILFADLLREPRNRLWAWGAMMAFESFIKVILYRYTNNPFNRELINGMKYMNRLEFLQFLAGYPPNRSMLRDYFDFDPDNCRDYVMPRKGSDIFFFLQDVLSRFGGTFLSEDGDDTIYDYLHGRYGERLFIIHDHKKRHSLQMFELFFLKYLTDSLLSLSSDFRERLLLVLDEIDKVEHDFGLTQAVTLGRQFGLDVIVSTQSLESLYAIAPDNHGEHLTNASLSGFSMFVSFHAGDPYTINTLQKLYGSRRKMIMEMPLSRYGRPQVKSEMRPFVEDMDFANLGVGECYVKYRDGLPRNVKILLD